MATRKTQSQEMPKPAKRSSTPDDAGIVDRIKKAMESGDLKAVKRDCKRILQHVTDNPFLWHLFAAVCKLLGDYEEYVVAMSKVQELAPDDPEYLPSIGEFLRIKDDPEARPFLVRAVKRHPSCTETRFQLAFLDYDEGKYAAAIRRCTTILKVDPESTQVYNLRGIVRHHQGKFLKAELDFKEYCRRVPDDPYGRLNLATAHFNQGELEEAYLVLLMVRPAMEDHAGALAMLALTCGRMGKMEEAQKYHWAAVEVADDDAATQDILHRSSRVITSSEEESPGVADGPIPLIRRGS